MLNDGFFDLEKETNGESGYGSSSSRNKTQSGSNSSSSVNAIREKQRKDELSSRLFTPEGSPIVPRKNKTWKPSVLNLSCSMIGEAQIRQSMHIGQYVNQVTPTKKNKNDKSVQKANRPRYLVNESLDETVLVPGNTSSPFQSTMTSSNESFRVNSGRNVLAQKMFDGVNESQIPEPIFGEGDESHIFKRSTKSMARAESSMTSSRSSLPSNSTIDRALDKGVDATTFLAEMEARREQKAAMRDSRRQALETSGNASSAKENERPDSLARESRPASQASTVSNSKETDCRSQLDQSEFHFIADLKKRRDILREKVERQHNTAMRLLKASKERKGYLTIAPSQSGRLPPRNISAISATVKNAVGSVTIGDKEYDLVERT
uniref:Uncharacterized protein n=1 Tax=Steinernema glaseri TaxID=37863 RepID=A0A1I7YTI6_9BILA